MQRNQLNTIGIGAAWRNQWNHNERNDNSEGFNEYH